MIKTTEKVKGIAEPIVTAQGLNLVDIEYIKEGANWILRVFIENEKGELNIDKCKIISKLLSKELDRVNPINNSYILEVSSPGIERTLKHANDYKRFTGKLIKVKTYAPINGKKEITGKLEGINNDVIKINIGDKKGVVEIPLNKIAQANLTIVF